MKTKRQRTPEEEEARKARHAAWEAEEAEDVADWSRRRQAKAEENAKQHRQRAEHQTAQDYQTFGLPADADFDTVKSAYRKLAMLYHPDLHPGDDEAAKKMAQINRAFSNIQTAKLKSMIKEVVSRYLRTR